MKLATLKSNDTRDGVLYVVNKSLTKAIAASQIAPNLQFALDNWQSLAPKLQTLYQQLNEDKVNTHCIDFNQSIAVLPCHELINGQMLQPMSTTLNWYAKLGVQACQRTFGQIHSCTRAVLIDF